MPTDPNILLAGQPPQIQSPLDAFTKAVGLKSSMAEAQTKGVAASLALRSLSDDQQVRDAFSRNIIQDPTTGSPGLDRQGVLRDLYSSAPLKAQQVQQEWALSDQKQAQAKLELSTAQLKQHQDALDTFGKLLGGVENADPTYKPQAYQQALRTAQQWGLDVTKAPPVYGPDAERFVQSQRAQTISYQNQIDEHLAVAKLAEEKREADQKAQLEQRGQDVTASTARRGQDLQYGNTAVTMGADGQPQGNSEAIAQAIAKGQLAPFSGRSLTQPRNQGIMARVLEINPSYSAMTFPVAESTRKAFATGPQGQQLTSFNTAISHLGILQDAMDKLQNGDTRAFNAVGNWFSTQTGQPAPTNFETAREAVGAEMAKAFSGSNVTQAERDKAAAALSSASSPAQLSGAIQTSVQLLHGKLGAMNEQFKNNSGGSELPNGGVSPEAAKVLQRLAPAPNQGQQPSAALPKIASPSDPAFTALPAGAHFLGPDGQERVKH